MDMEANTNTSMLCVGDMHVRMDNLAAAEKMASFCIEECAKRACGVVAVLGDLLHYHKKLMTQPMNAVVGFLKELLDSGLKVVVLVGNHDMLSNQTYLDTEGHWMGSLKHWAECAEGPLRSLWIVDEPVVLRFGAASVTCCPYVPPGKFVCSLDRLGRRVWTSSDVVIAHQEMLGAKMGAIVSSDGDAWDAEWPLLVSGHIHDRQWIGHNVYYAGSSMQHSIAEQDSKTLAVVALRGGGSFSGRVVEIPTRVFASAGVLRKHVSSLSTAAGVRDMVAILSQMKAEGGIQPTLRLRIGTAEGATAVRKTAAFKRLQKCARIIFDQDSCDAGRNGEDDTGADTFSTPQRITLSVWQERVCRNLDEGARHLFAGFCGPS